MGSPNVTVHGYVPSRTFQNFYRGHIFTTPAERLNNVKQYTILETANNIGSGYFGS